MSDEEDCCDSDVGSMADLEWDTCADACTLAVGAFPPERLRSGRRLCSGTAYGEECDNAVVSVGGDVPMSPVLHVTDKGVAMIPPVDDRHVQRTGSESVSWDKYSVRLCLLYPDSVEDLRFTRRIRG